MKQFNTQLFFKKVHEDAQIPTQRDGDVGFDLKAVEDAEIGAGKTLALRTGLVVAASPRSDLGAVFIKIEDRSSMAKKGLFSHGGIIDPSYRGEFTVVLYNSSDSPYQVKKGDKIAQAVVYPAAFNDSRQSSVVHVHEELQADETARGTGGFGSTGR